MTGIQATERHEIDLPMRPGKVERREFEYVRHGTQSLMGASQLC
jgi:putative transposase